MSFTRAAAYLGCASLCVAWLASAAGVGERPIAPATESQAVQSTGTETLAEDVQAQTDRLKVRLAAAPAPRNPLRNPFAFAPKPVAAPSRPAPASTVAAAPVVFPEPVLLLVGVAADQTPAGLVRTAIVTAESGEAFIVKVGDSIGGRYRVETIGADAVDLSDLTSGAIRRLALR